MMISKCKFRFAWKAMGMFVAALGAIALLPGAAAFAQGPGGPGGPFQAMRAWNQAHPNVGAVGRTLRGLSDLENGPSKLNARQARKVLAVIEHWQTRPVMTDPQAAKVNALILSYLNPAQKAQVTARRGGFGGRPGGFGGGPGGRPGGGRPGGFGGGRPGGFTAPAPHDYNPLNPSTLPFAPMRSRMQAREDALIAALKSTH